ncbi:MAG TPA: hypothetical protein ENH84_03850 [Phycisphaerae bacterium]|nr:hypothetical protein [Phycisphaerae bacterium]
MNEPKTERPVVFWDCDDDAEILNYSEKNNAIEMHLDGRDKWDGTITVYGYARMIAPVPDAETVLENIFEGEWEEYVNENWPGRSIRMSQIAQQFVEAIHAEFKPWVCEVVTSEEVDVAEWIAENRPTWLEDRKDKE